MLMTGIVIILFALILLMDFVPIFDTVAIKEKIVYCAIMLTGFVVLILYTLDIPVPSPVAPIKKLIETLIPNLK